MAAKKEEGLKAEIENALELEEAIIHISKGAKALLGGRLKEEALFLLVQQAIKPASSRPTLEQIRLVLYNASKLEEIYLKPPEKK